VFTYIITFVNIYKDYIGNRKAKLLCVDLGTYNILIKIKQNLTQSNLSFQRENPVMKYNFFCWIVANIAANQCQGNIIWKYDIVFIHNC